MITDPKCIFRSGCPKKEYCRSVGHCMNIVEPPDAPPSETVYECNACDWRGPGSETVHPKHDDTCWMCPECHETITPAGHTRECELAMDSGYMCVCDLNETSDAPSSNLESQLREALRETLKYLPAHPQDRSLREAVDNAQRLLRVVPSAAPETTPQAPIAKVIVREDDTLSVSLYAPGLPIGEHDLYCEPPAPGGQKVPHPCFESAAPGTSQTVSAEDVRRVVEWCANHVNAPMRDWDRQSHVLLAAADQLERVPVETKAPLPEYTTAIGEAGDKYLRSITLDGARHWFPGTFHWYELWEVMCRAALPGVSEGQGTPEDYCKHGALLGSPCKQCGGTAYLIAVSRAEKTSGEQDAFNAGVTQAKYRFHYKDALQKILASDRMQSHDIAREALDSTPEEGDDHAPTCRTCGAPLTHVSENKWRDTCSCAQMPVLDRSSSDVKARHTLDCAMVKHRNCTYCDCGSSIDPNSSHGTIP